MIDAERVQKLTSDALEATRQANPWEAIIALRSAADAIQNRLSVENLMMAMARAMNPPRK